MIRRQTSRTSVHTIIRQFILFAGVGVVGTTAHYLTLIILVEIANVDAVLSSGLGYLCGAIVNYALNRAYTFKTTQRHIDAFPKFLFVAGIGLLFNAAIMGITTRKLHIPYLLGQIIATAVVLLWNFIGNLFWTFRLCPKANIRPE